jgi:hypothetical protein
VCPGAMWHGMEAGEIGPEMSYAVDWRELGRRTIHVWAHDSQEYALSAGTTTRRGRSAFGKCVLCVSAEWHRGQGMVSMGTAYSLFMKDA